jgi:hypothetical protein
MYEEMCFAVYAAYYTGAFPTSAGLTTNGYMYYIGGSTTPSYTQTANMTHCGGFYVYGLSTACPCSECRICTGSLQTNI